MTRRWLRRLGRTIRWSAVFSFVLVVATVVVLLIASSYATPAVEQRPVDAKDPATVAENAVWNLRASEYRYEVRTVEWGYRGGPERPTATIVQRARIDNGARRFVYGVTMPGRYDGAAGAPRVRIFGESSLGGKIYTPPRLATDGPPGWERDRTLGYYPGRNAFHDPSRLRGADWSVVTENASTLVLRLDDTENATLVAYPGSVTDSTFGGGRTLPPTSNATATLTLTVDRENGRVRRAVYRYVDRDTGHHVRGVYAFDDYGDVTVSRPVGAYPPEPLVLIDRLDLGVATIAGADYGGFAAVVFPLAVLGCVFGHLLGGERW